MAESRATGLYVVDSKSDRNARSVGLAAEVLRLEAMALLDLAENIGESFGRIISLFEGISGRVVLTGMGKSGHIARKISSTLASTGTPSFFVHPGEAGHGDLGMISLGDAVLALSNSGETAELFCIIEYIRRFSIPLVSITHNPSSTLARHSDFVLVTPRIREACPLGLAPTTSTTMMLALGDAMAAALVERRGFSQGDFKVFHPGGRLGQKLQMVKDFMRKGELVPTVKSDARLADAILEISSKGCGCTGVMKGSRLIGIITDGDLRRHLKEGILDRTAGDIMSRNPKTIQENALIGEAVGQMNAHKITSLFVVENGRPIGIIHMHDCLRASRSGLREE